LFFFNNEINFDLHVVIRSLMFQPAKYFWNSFWYYDAYLQDRFCRNQQLACCLCFSIDLGQHMRTQWNST